MHLKDKNDANSKLAEHMPTMKGRMGIHVREELLIDCKQRITPISFYFSIAPISVLFDKSYSTCDEEKDTTQKIQHK